MNVPSNFSEQVFNDLIHNQSFEISFTTGGRTYPMREIVEIVALGLSGRNDLVESDPVKLHARITAAIIEVVSVNAILNSLSDDAVAVVAKLLANHVLAKAFLLNEGIA